MSVMSGCAPQSLVFGTTQDFFRPLFTFFHLFLCSVVPPAMVHATLLLDSHLGHMRLVRAPGGAAMVGHVGVCNSKCVFGHNPRFFVAVVSHFSFIFGQGRSPSGGSPCPAIG